MVVGGEDRRPADEVVRREDLVQRDAGGDDRLALFVALPFIEIAASKTKRVSSK